MRNRKVITIIILIAVIVLNGCGMSGKEKVFDYNSVEMIPVNYSFIEKIGYDGDFDTLLIRFRKDGSLYAYYQVSDDVYDELMAAESI